jgi:hypothetical protein
LTPKPRGYPRYYSAESVCIRPLPERCFRPSTYHVFERENRGPPSTGLKTIGHTWYAADSLFGAKFASPTALQFLLPASRQMRSRIRRPKRVPAHRRLWVNLRPTELPLRTPVRRPKADVSPARGHFSAVRRITLVAEPNHRELTLPPVHIEARQAREVPPRKMRPKAEYRMYSPRAGGFRLVEIVI